MSSPGEQARGLMMPVQVYPLFEQAHRVVLGRDLDEHLVAMSELWAGFSEVAATNPHAWIQRGVHRRGDPHAVARQPDDRVPVHEAAELQQRGGAGRRGDPVLGRARPSALGVPRDRWVFPHSGTDAHDHYFVSERDDLGRSPAMRVAGRACARAGRRGRRRPRPHRPLLVLPVGGGDLGLRARHQHRSPAHRHRRPLLRRRAVEQLRDALDRHDGRPAARRARHRSASSAPTAASSPSTPSACTAPSRRPPRSGTPTCRPRWTRSPSASSARSPTARSPSRRGRPCTTATATPETGIVVGLLDDGRRAIGTTQDADALKALVTEDIAGRRARRRARRRDRPRCSGALLAVAVLRGSGSRSS